LIIGLNLGVAIMHRGTKQEHSIILAEIKQIKKENIKVFRNK